MPISTVIQTRLCSCGRLSFTGACPKCKRLIPEQLQNMENGQTASKLLKRKKIAAKVRVAEEGGKFKRPAG